VTHGSLFSGIGGFDLAAEWMGWDNVFHCEWNEFGQKVLSYYWPKSISYNDIKETDFTIHRGAIEVLTGGFPCQPYSLAGKRLGKEDERHLWPEMLRAIREIQPRYIVGENVRGLTNWNGGLVFDEVQAQMETEGYEVLPFLLPACAVNAPHRRDRIWFISRLVPDTYSDGFTWDKKSTKRCNDKPNRISQHESDTLSTIAITPNANRQRSSEPVRQQQRSIHKKKEKYKRSELDRRITTLERWSGWPTISPFCNGIHGISKGLDGITFSKWREESIMGGGNAIVPQIALEIFKAIAETH